MAAELKSAFGVDSELRELGKGIFDVLKDGDLVYSKHKTGRFPEPGELTRLLRRD